MVREKPGDRRGFVHKRIGGAISGLISGGPTGALSGFLRPTGAGVAGCQAGFVRNAAGQCVRGFDDPRAPTIALPQFFGGGAGTVVATATVSGVPAGTFVAPQEGAVRRRICPRFQDGKVGILWMSPFTGEVVCMPRGFKDGKSFGLIRAVKPGKKPPISVSQVNAIAAYNSAVTAVGRLSDKLGCPR